MHLTCSCGKTYFPSQAWMHKGCMANRDMANKDAPDSMANTYRYRDAEKRKAYMREYMKKRRGR